MQTSLATIGFLVHISETCLVLLMNYCVSNELRVLKKNIYMKNIHKKVIIDDTGFRVDSVSLNNTTAKYQLNNAIKCTDNALKVETCFCIYFLYLSKLVSFNLLGIHAINCQRCFCNFSNKMAIKTSACVYFTINLIPTLL